MATKSGFRFIQDNFTLNVSKKADFLGWYNQLLIKSEMINDYNVPGLYIIRPWAYSIWESVHDYLQQGFKEIGVKNVSLPLFVPFMNRLGERYDDIAPNTTYLTHAGNVPVEHLIAIRPTSESLVYSDFGRWCRSWRDLPFKINHWCNTIRWHDNPIPFLLSREFLLQEGYSGFTNREEAVEEVYKMLDIYKCIYNDLFAIPVLLGKKSEAGKLTGSDFSTAIQIIVPDNGVGIQGATSTHLGQNFSKKFSIYFDNPKQPGEKEYIWLTRYTISIRSIGALVMVHGDDSGLILPPKVAPFQIVLIPSGLNNCKSESYKEQIIKDIISIGDKLREAGLRVEIDIRKEISGELKSEQWKFKGVPILLEINPFDLKSRKILSYVRFNNEKYLVGLDNLADELKHLLAKIQCDMLTSKTEQLNKQIEICYDWNHFILLLNKQSVLLSPFCGHHKCEQLIESNLKSSINGINIKLLNIPFEQPKEDYFNKKCINPKCKENAQFFSLFGQNLC